MRLPALCLALLSAAAFAAEPFLKPNDVIALVGGEDMVVAGELGYLELLLTRALPGHRLKFRTLAWEGDTVFEQRRDLNFPPLEKQLDEIGATVVLCQFGQMESLAGKEKLPEFVAAYEKLLGRMSGGGKRKFMLIAPTFFEKGRPSYELPVDPSPNRTFPQIEPNLVLSEYRIQIGAIAKAHGFPLVRGTLSKAELVEAGRTVDENFDPSWPTSIFTRDGVHAAARGHVLLRMYFKEAFPELRDASISAEFRDEGHIVRPKSDESLRQQIIAKNRLWFDYWRVENWAFLAGDRTSQPSSRDHLDKTQRWFPAERDRFLPLIDAREKEIWAAAAQLK